MRRARESKAPAAVTSSLSAPLRSAFASLRCPVDTEAGIPFAEPCVKRTRPYEAIACAVSGDVSPTVARKMRSASAMWRAARGSSSSFSCTLPTDMCALAMIDESTVAWPFVCSRW